MLVTERSDANELFQLISAAMDLPSGIDGPLVAQSIEKQQGIGAFSFDSLDQILDLRAVERERVKETEHERHRDRCLTIRKRF